MRRLALGLLLLAAAALGACGGDDRGADGEPASGGGPAVPWLDPDGEFPVVGSLAVNPADGALWTATNTGLFRIEEGASRPERVTGTLTTPDGSGAISEQLVVQFTGPDELLGSGHPAGDETGLPDVLGLIRSDDAAKSWTSVSELGSADFHAIEQSGARLAGALSGQPQVLVSEDDGRTWSPRAAPSAPIDLALDPDNPDRWAATTADGVFVSADGGGSPGDGYAHDRRPVPGPARADDRAGRRARAVHRLDPGAPADRLGDRHRLRRRAGSAADGLVRAPSRPPDLGA